MATIDSKEIIADLLRANGHYDDDPQALRIYQYENTRGVETYSLCYTSDCITSIMSSPFVKNPVPLWTRERGLTVLGAAFLKTVSRPLEPR